MIRTTVNIHRVLTVCQSLFKELDILFNPHLILNVIILSRLSYSFYFTNREIGILGDEVLV